MIEKLNNPKQIGVDEIPFGKTLLYSIFDCNGIVLRKQGEVIRKSDLTRHRRRVRGGLFVNVEQYNQQFDHEAANKIRELAIGTILSCDVLDHHGRLLQTAGTRVSQKFLDMISHQDISIVEHLAKSQPSSINKQESLDSPVRKELVQSLDRLLIETKASQMTIVQDSPLPKPHLSLNKLREEAAQGIKIYRQTENNLAEIFENAASGQQSYENAPIESVQQTLYMTLQDPSLAMMLMKYQADEQGEYLYRHGINVSMLAMQIALTLGWKLRDIQALGLAAMFQDIGMLDIPEAIRFAPRALSQSERLEMQRHPAYSVNRLEKIKSLNPLVLLLTFQSHERIDRSGYPKKRHKKFIHPLACILHVADIFCAVTCERPYRQAVMPYHGMTTILKEVRAGRLDQYAAKALLDTISLFPIGSYVRLSDQRLARVARSNGSLHRKPIIIPLYRNGMESDIELDLAKADNLTITEILNLKDIEAILANMPIE